MSAHRTDSDAQPMLRRLESLTVVAIVGLLSLALGLAALVRPATTAKTQTLAYTQSGSFSYSATAPQSSVYGAGGLVSGEPILTKLVGPVQAAFAYHLDAKAPTDVHGTAALGLTVDLGQGLSKKFALAASAPFSGNRTSIKATLPLGAISSYVGAALRDLGNGGAGTATVTIRPQIQVAGVVGGRELVQTTYSPGLAFTMNDGTLALASASGVADSSVPASDPLNTKDGGSIRYEASQPNTVPLVVAHPSVTSSRIAGFALAALCLLLCLWLARPLRAGKSPGDRERIRTLYGSQLVPVDAFAVPKGPVADVSSIESLADLAKRYESMIMHVEESHADLYLVWDNGMLYRFRAEHELPVADEAPEAIALDEQAESTTDPDSGNRRRRVEAARGDTGRRRTEELSLADVNSMLAAPSYLRPVHARVGAKTTGHDTVGEDLIERLFNGQTHTD